MHHRWDFFAPVNSTGRGVPPPPFTGRLQLLCQCFFHAMRGSTNQLSNWLVRPALADTAKVFQKVSDKQQYDYMENNSILHKQQYDFRAKKWPFYTQAILHFLQYLHKQICTGNVVFSLFLDFRNAFDCVNHEILLPKLNTYGIRGITLGWFLSYLTNREQYVWIIIVNSNPKVVECGVLQGSILGQ